MAKLTGQALRILLSRAMVIIEIDSDTKTRRKTYTTPFKELLAQTCAVYGIQIKKVYTVARGLIQHNLTPGVLSGKDVSSIRKYLTTYPDLWPKPLFPLNDRR